MSFLSKRSIKGGKIVNEGKLSSAPGGFVALLADDVRNSGIVLAEKERLLWHLVVRLNSNLLKKII